MPDSNLMGHMDRRKKLPSKQIRVKDAIEKIYSERGFTGSRNVYDPDSTYMLESECFRHALAGLEPDDREEVRDCSKRLQDHMLGKQFGEGSALQVLAKVGIFLALAEKERR